ncbi:MAG TPA: acyl-CoA carboxylase epsilon subunit [Nakamurella sp.]
MSGRTDVTVNSSGHDDEDDAAALLAVLLVISASAPDHGPETIGAHSVWGEPAHRLGLRSRPSASGWWASGLPR